MKKTLLTLLVTTILVSATAMTSLADSTLGSNEVHHNEGYDSEHPLAGKIDEWDLGLPTKYLGEFTICNDNVQAMLTGQMDQYYMPPVGYSVNPTTGTQMYIGQEDYNNKITNEQALYTWFCNWLNGMDFENMSEIDKAKEIQKILEQKTYELNTAGDISAEYEVLINGKGDCLEFAMTACSLAKTLGLKCATSGTATHAVYYIQVDGIAYMGSNQILNLDYPTTDNVYFQ